MDLHLAGFCVAFGPAVLAPVAAPQAELGSSGRVATCLAANGGTARAVCAIKRAVTLSGIGVPVQNVRAMAATSDTEEDTAGCFGTDLVTTTQMADVAFPHRKHSSAGPIDSISTMSGRKIGLPARPMSGFTDGANLMVGSTLSCGAQP